MLLVLLCLQCLRLFLFVTVVAVTITTSTGASAAELIFLFIADLPAVGSFFPGLVDSKLDSFGWLLLYI